MRHLMLSLAFAGLLATGSAASRLEYPNPVLTEYGLVLFINDKSHPAYRPMDGIDQLFSGKGGSAYHPESLSWASATSELIDLTGSETTDPVFRIPPGLIDNPACPNSQAPSLPWFCDQPHTPGDPDTSVPAVPLPLPFLLLLSALAGLGSVTLFSAKSTRLERNKP